ncbi:dihydroorotate dehydrogenase [Senegalia massiliensis]|uniref:Dihydroorotate dehydrogenase n=1 Tax=Senegalia massiliensis TaxID=1720316 RepID=A0A845QTZ5_9CLOT|nr:dihydroorotate dehydrogenase [Senegalia massiliensis]NBI06317.1 dihydroorotate dehydrogenase [Senegalia massiliensis]
MSNLNIEFGKVKFKNPVITASGTFGFGREYKEIYDIDILGGISTKGITKEKRDGNTGMRIYETSSGIMNSVGLENPGVEGFLKDEIPFLEKLNTNIIVNIGGACESDYLYAIEKVSETNIDMIELNISCPNVKAGGMAFGIKTKDARQIVKSARRVTNLPLVVKLSPNAEDIVDIARACEEEGADGLSLVNTFKGLAIDIEKRKPIFENIYAGVSGPSIKPMALRMVNEVYKNTNIPIMGMGGIMNATDAIEFIMAGSTCIQVGTANFVNPRIAIDIIKGIDDFMEKEGIKSLEEIIGII